MKTIAKPMTNKPRRANTPKAGFTMVELLIVVAVFAILVAAGIPMLVGQQDRGVRDATNQLVEVMQNAKLLAIKEQQNCTISINIPNPNQYTISLTNEVIDLALFPGGVTFSNSPIVSASTITFTPQGLSNPAGAILLTSQVNPEIYRIRTTGSGGISKHQWIDSQWK